MDLSERIYRWRQKSKRTTAEVAREIGLFPAAITQWESGKTVPTTGHLAKFVEAIGLTMERFYGTTPPPAKRKRRAA